MLSMILTHARLSSACVGPWESSPNHPWQHHHRDGVLDQSLYLPQLPREGPHLDMSPSMG